MEVLGTEVQKQVKNLVTRTVNIAGVETTVVRDEITAQEISCVLQKDGVTYTGKYNMKIGKYFNNMSNSDESEEQRAIYNEVIDAVKGLVEWVDEEVG